MKKALVALAVAGFASSALALVAGGPHDLSNNAGSPWVALNGQLSACQYCHAPHNVNLGITGAPLWNRGNATGGAFTLYTSATLQAPTPVSGEPNANSMTCLSCHDGTSDLGATYTGSPGFAGPIQITNAAFTSTGGNGLVGKDLRNDHPVSIQYPTSSLNYRALNAFGGTGIRFYSYPSGSNFVECGSCHDPHNYDNAAGTGVPFLRMSKTQLCTTCHLY